MTPQPETSGEAFCWTDQARSRFLEILGEAANVSGAARDVGSSRTGAYRLRSRDPEFARQWMEALEQGYCELEMLLLRHALEGSRQVETVEEFADDDQDICIGQRGRGAPAPARRRVRTVSSYPYAMAMQLLAAHRRSIEAYRRSEGIDRASGEAVRAEIMARLERMRGGGAVAPTTDMGEEKHR